MRYGVLFFLFVLLRSCTPALADQTLIDSEKGFTTFNTHPTDMRPVHPHSVPKVPCILHKGIVGTVTDHVSSYENCHLVRHRKPNGERGEWYVVDDNGKEHLYTP